MRVKISGIHKRREKWAENKINKKQQKLKREIQFLSYLAWKNLEMEIFEKMKREKVSSSNHDWEEHITDQYQL